MLLHARGKPGVRLPTGINAMLAEYVNLNYHSNQALDNTFDIKIESDYDPLIGQGSVIPQEISRIFINLGLSITFDIIVHQHKGEIRVESLEGEFAEFIITLPKTI